MKIELLNKKIHKLSIEKNKSDKKDDFDIHLKLHHEVYGNNKNNFIFRVRYSISVIVEDECEVKLQYDFDFKSDIEVSEGFSSSETIRSIVPAIAYPYIKVYVENLIAASGYKSIRMPYVDFIENPLELAD